MPLATRIGVSDAIAVEDADRQDFGAGRHEADDPGNVRAVSRAFIDLAVGIVIDAVGRVDWIGIFCPQSRTR